jgi:hypothetical protein
MSRSGQREGFPDLVRVRLLEDDVDAIEGAMVGIRRLMQGLLVTITGGSIFLALNLVVGNGL